MVTVHQSAIFYYALLSNHSSDLYSMYNKMIRIQAACKHINNAFMLVDVRDFSALLPSNHVENCCAVLLLILLQRGSFLSFFYILHTTKSAQILSKDFEEDCGGSASSSRDVVNRVG